MNECPRHGCNEHLHRLGEADGFTYWRCGADHFARGKNGADESEALTEIGALQVPGTITLTEISREQE